MKRFFKLIKYYYKNFYIFLHNKRKDFFQVSFISWASLVAQSVKTACIAGDPGLTPGWGKSPGEGNGNPLSCLENSMDRRGFSN